MHRRTPLWYAAANGCLSIVQSLIKHGANLKIEGQDLSEYTYEDILLLKAAKTNH